MTNYGRSTARHCCPWRRARPFMTSVRCSGGIPKVSGKPLALPWAIRGPAGTGLGALLPDIRPLGGAWRVKNTENLRGSAVLACCGSAGVLAFSGGLAAICRLDAQRRGVLVGRVNAAILKLRD
jgi:hypothetical protein